jgi:hypothetical protein
VSDRELLKLAAKVAGATRGDWGMNCFWLDGAVWNPLTDDGDALRLTVKLKMLVGPNTASRDPMVFAWAREQGGIAQYQFIGADPAAATRRAIVRAAAEIARAAA